MARKRKTTKGRGVYARRKTIIEPVFGQMQAVQDTKRLPLRDEDAARAQWRFPKGAGRCLEAVVVRVWVPQVALGARGRWSCTVTTSR